MSRVEIFRVLLGSNFSGSGRVSGFQYKKLTFLAFGFVRVVKFRVRVRSGLAKIGIFGFGSGFPVFGYPTYHYHTFA